MVENFNSIVEIMKRRIAHDLRYDNTNGVLDIVLNAYNRFQKDEIDGVDYIFDITIQNDLKCMVEGGLTVPDNEKQFEADIEAYLTSAAGGWQKADDAGYRSGFQHDASGALTENYALDLETLRRLWDKMEVLEDY